MKTSQWITIIICLCIISGLKIYHLNMQEKQYELSNDLNITQMAEKSYYLGCIEVTRDFSFCKQKAHIFKAELIKEILERK